VKAGTAGATHTLMRSSPMAGTETFKWLLLLLLLAFEDSNNQNMHAALRFGGM